jgi:TonB-linked SusC/RagA family outer membrane protein
MKKLLLICMWVLISMASHVYGQTPTIAGTVTEKEQGGPLPGVSVVIKGSRTGTLSNAQGKFSISASIGQTLVFSTIGYKTQTIVLSGPTVTIVMEPSQSELSEVMVIGYGTQLRRDNVAAVSQIKGADLTEQPVQNFEQALGGKAPGVQITIPNSVLNTPPVFHIRGTSSINLSSQPLIVVDGIVSLTGDFSGGESGGNALSNINPDDIEDIQVLKDASATAIYGSRGANGVVLVTTKKGKKGDAVFTLDSWLGETSVNRLPSVLNANQYVAIKTEAIANGGGNPLTTAVVINNDANGNPINTNWENLLYQKGISYNTTFSVSGGNDKTTYYGSVNWSKQTGVLRSYEYDNKSALINIEHKLTKAITFGAKLSYQNNQNLASIGSGSLSGEAYNTTGLGRQALLLPPNLSPYNNDGSYNLNPSTGALGVMGDKNISISYTNPIVSIDLDRYNNEINHVSASTYLQIKPLSWITLKTVYGIDYIFTSNDLFNDPVQNFSVAGGVVTNNASATDSYLSTKHYTWDNTAQFDKSFGKHSFSLLFGNEQEGVLQNGFGLNRSILSDPAFNVIQAGFQNVATSSLNLSTTYLVSFFSRFNYNFDEKYFLTASLRRDGASQFGSDKKYGLFPSLGGGWEITKENFWKKMGADKVFSSFKLRGSYGVVGNNSGLGAYASYGLYSATGLYNGNGTVVPSQTGNNSLSWETTYKSDGGIDFGLFNDRITASIDAYYDNTTGLILNYPEAPSAGLPTSPPVNIGTMFNRGLEFNVNADIVKTRSFHWTANFNISFNQNKITSLIPGTNSITYSTSGLETANINQVGGAIGDLYIIRSAGIDPANGDRVFLNAQGQKVDYTFTGTQHWFNQDGTPYVAKLGTGINQTADASDYGNTAPKEYGGLSNTFRYKDFDLNVLLTYQLGFYVYYGTQATLTDQRFWNNSTVILDHWTTPGQVAAYPKVVFGDNVSNGTSFPTDFNTYRGDFLKVKTINLGYTLPKALLSKIGVKSIRVYVSGQNLFIVTKYPGPDPEVSSNGTSINGNSSQGVDRNTAGNGRTLIAGFSLKF